MKLCTGYSESKILPQFLKYTWLCIYFYKCSVKFCDINLSHYRDAADRAARALGSAMQRTNILRDIDEDLANGRVYIARAALQRCGLDSNASEGPTSLRDGDRRALLREEIARAEAEYVEGISGIRYLQHGGRSIRAAALLYREILRQIERDGLGARRPHRSVVGQARKALLLLQALISSGGSEARA